MLDFNSDDYYTEDGSEYDDSSSEYDDSSDEELEENNDYYYDPEEKSPTKFSILICELYNERIHGFTSESNVKYNYLVNCRFKKLDIKYISDYSQLIKNWYNYLLINNNSSHIIFRNYKNIISNPNYIKPEIAECIELDTKERIAILKTTWIRLIQRTWKKIFNMRKNITNKRQNLTSLRHRELTGKWPSDCSYCPTIYGMLSYLN
jgi:hypothetical protein